MKIWTKMRSSNPNLKTRITDSTTTSNFFAWSLLLTMSVLNANNLTLEVKKIVKMLKKKLRNLNLRSWFVVNAQLKIVKWEKLTAKSTEQTTLNSNANFVAA